MKTMKSTDDWANLCNIDKKAHFLREWTWKSRRRTSTRVVLEWHAQFLGRYWHSWLYLSTERSEAKYKRAIKIRLIFVPLTRTLPADFEPFVFNANSRSLITRVDWLTPFSVPWIKVQRAVTSITCNHLIPYNEPIISRIMFFVMAWLAAGQLPLKSVHITFFIDCAVRDNMANLEKSSSQLMETEMQDRSRANAGVSLEIPEISSFCR